MIFVPDYYIRFRCGVQWEVRALYCAVCRCSIMLSADTILWCIYVCTVNTQTWPNGICVITDNIWGIPWKCAKICVKCGKLILNYG